MWTSLYHLATSRLQSRIWMKEEIQGPCIGPKKPDTRHVVFEQNSEQREASDIKHG